MGLRVEPQRSPSFFLKGYLSQARWSRYDLAGQALVCCRLPWPHALDPFAVLDWPGNRWRFYWRAKDALDSYVGLGQVLATLRPDQDLLDRVAGERWFMSLPFSQRSDQSPKASSPWHDLEEGMVVLPQIEWSLSAAHQELTARILVDQNTDENEIQQRITHLLRDILPVTLSRNHETIPAVTKIVNQPTEDDWEKMIATAIEQINNDRFSKVVLSRTKRFEFSKSVELAPILHRLNEFVESSYLFAVRSPKGSGFLGRSPERLLSWDAHSYYLDAIAGTRRRSSSRQLDFSEASDLRSSSKDLAEHRYVSDYVQSILKRFATHVEPIEKESLLRLKNVQHIRSRFRGIRKPQSSPIDLLKELHPTPAVGGLPKNEAIDFIQSSEPFERGLFAGAFGVIQGQSMGELAIGIRTALVNDQVMTLFAGAGIVKESDPRSEWLETEMKMKNFMDLFQAKSP